MKQSAPVENTFCSGASYLAATLRSDFLGQQASIRIRDQDQGGRLTWKGLGRSIMARSTGKSAKDTDTLDTFARGRQLQGSAIRSQRPWARAPRLAAAAALALFLLPLGACAGFFIKPAATNPTDPTNPTNPVAPTPTNTGDYAYVANSSAGITSLSEYNVGAGSLASVGTINLGYIPVALAVAPTNTFLYVASAPGSANPGIYLYNIATGGALSVANSGTALATDQVASMAVSPDGNWLFTVNSSGITMNEYQVTTGTGLLTLKATITLPGTDCLLSVATPTSQTCSVAVSPSEEYVVASLGTAGDAVFSYTSAAGITGSNFNTIASGYSTTNPTGDFSVVLDSNNFAYIAQTNSLVVYQINSTITEEGTLGYAAGTTPRSVSLNKSGNTLFTANEGTGTISSFGISGNGALAAVAGSPFTGPANVSALGVDNSGLYLVAVGYDASAGVRLYSVSSTGVLKQVAMAAAGTNPVLPALVAMTH